MSKGDQIFHEALAAWAPRHPGLDDARSLLMFLTGTEYTDARTHLMAGIESMINAERYVLLDAHYEQVCGGIANARPEHYQKFETDQQLRARLYRLVEFYRVPRTFLHLFLHAHLFQALGRKGPIDELTQLLDRWDS